VKRHAERILATGFGAVVLLHGIRDVEGQRGRFSDPSADSIVFL